MSQRILETLILGALTIAALLPCTGCATKTRAELDGWDSFGASISTEQPLSLSTILAHPEHYDGQTVLLEATIAECCQSKGCWMTLEQGTQSVRVKFLDYGFFVPMDSAGRTVRLEGVFEIRDVPVEEARHYLEDAGRDEEAATITEPQRSFEIVTSGVLLSAVS
jgi:hypothetical protein